MITATIDTENGEHKEMKFDTFQEFTSWVEAHYYQFSGFSAETTGGEKNDNRRSEQADP